MLFRSWQSLCRELDPKGVWWKSELEFPTSRRNPHLSELIIPKTRLYVNLTEARKLRIDLLILLVASLAAGPAVGGALTAAKKLHEALRWLTDDEAELVGVVAGLARPNPYDNPVAESDIRRAYADATLDVNALLDGLEARKILRRRRPAHVQLVK